MVRFRRGIGNGMSMTGRYFKVAGGEVVSGPHAREALRHPHASVGVNTPDADLVVLGFLPEDRTGFEPFDQATQKRSGPVLTVGADKVTAAYTVTDKTAQEIDDEKALQADALFSAFALVVLDEFNVIRAALANAGVPNMAPRTVQQLKNAVKAKL